MRFKEVLDKTIARHNEKEVKRMVIRDRWMEKVKAKVEAGGNRYICPHVCRKDQAELSRLYGLETEINSIYAHGTPHGQVFILTAKK